MRGRGICLGRGILSDLVIRGWIYLDILSKKTDRHHFLIFAIIVHYPDRCMSLLKFRESYFLTMGEQNKYACPICLTKFSIENDALPLGLTREHVPPHSLGGTVKCYTCRKCNSDLGADADKQLLIGIKQNKETFLKTMVDQPIKIKEGDWTFQGQMSANDGGNYQMLHSKKNNHPNKLENFMGQISDGSQLSLQYVLQKFDNHLFNVGLLKSAYLKLFSVMGFEIVFNTAYDIVRAQLMTPQNKIYFQKTVLSNAFTADQAGVYKVDIENCRLICVVLNLTYMNFTHTFGVLLPDTDLDFINSLSFISTIHAYTPKDEIFPIDKRTSYQFNKRLSGDFSLLKSNI